MHHTLPPSPTQYLLESLCAYGGCPVVHLTEKGEGSEQPYRVVDRGAMRTSENAHSQKLLAGSGVVAPPLYCCVSYVRIKRVRSCVHKKHNTRGYGRPLAGSLGPIRVRLCTLSRRRELRLNGVLRRTPRKVQKITHLSDAFCSKARL